MQGLFVVTLFQLFSTRNAPGAALMQRVFRRFIFSGERVKVPGFSAASPGSGKTLLRGYRRGLHLHGCNLESLPGLPHVVGALLCQPQAGFASARHTPARPPGAGPFQARRQRGHSRRGTAPRGTRRVAARLRSRSARTRATHRRAASGRDVGGLNMRALVDSPVQVCAGVTLRRKPTACSTL